MMMAGTGKTLVARALASHASKAGKKVSFFMRKGADILSKWVGEAERQLRLLFEEAQKAQPSIIFFDEIDGLAPVIAFTSSLSLQSRRWRPWKSVDIASLQHEYSVLLSLF
jgi:SpoVK/Ycf46/Vps4 family AAA+-type ATPase